MTIPFKQIPNNLRVPLFYAEVDNSQANSASTPQRALIIGQITAAGTATPNVPVISQGVGDAQTVGGPSSMLANMTAKYRLNDTVGEVWYLPVSDAGGAVAAVGSITITAAATTAGTLTFYIGDVRYQLPVLTTQTAAQVATALVALINADATCPFTASLTSTATVTLTADNLGPVANGYILQVNYGGTQAGEATPAGLTYTIVQPTGGTTAPTLTTALANLGAKTFDFIVSPYTDSVSLAALQALTAGRWSYAQQLYGGVFASADGNLSTLVTLGNARNNPYESIIGFYNSPTPAYLRAAAYGGACAASLEVDPAQPLQTVVLKGVLPPPQASRFVFSDQNTLLFNGISTYNVADDGTVSISGCITTYQKNGFGNADNSYLQVNTLYTLAFCLRAMATALATKYARVKFAADGTQFAPGSNIVTPSAVAAEILNVSRDLEYQGYLQNVDAMKGTIIVQQNANNPNRLDILWDPILIDQVNVLALLAQFRLAAV